MKIFSGFPAGKIEVTPLPNLFFSELIPAIDDLAELKVTLHIFWRLAHSKTTHVRASELRADRTLAQSLQANDAAPETEIERALARAVERGTLLHWASAEDDFYFLNTERGRRAHEKIESETLPRDPIAPEPIAAVARPNIFALYEQNIGLLTPMLAEELKEAEQQYPGEWIAEAIKIAVEQNKHSWSYARKILERWKTEGRGTKTKKKSWYGDEYGKLVKR
ncbi:MAG: DnaD domain protein [Anaerolineales bacterium]|nr:DnaD domain protein [Anaerolineales bacterium]